MVNLAAFQNDTDDMQLSIFTAAGASSSIIRNAGKAEVRGFELEGDVGSFGCVPAARQLRLSRLQVR